MKRMHLHVSVNDIDESIRFYSSLFGASPTVSKPDYAKWMLDDPCVNFAISNRGATPGLDHVGIQVDSHAELTEIKERLEKAELDMLTEEATTCCYAKSDKHWVQDPSGIAWETYHTLESAPTFSEKVTTAAITACCVPSTQKVQFISRKKS
jgi:catechol-2,3-dioxygenase